jgi:hypothetical protein
MSTPNRTTPERDPKAISKAAISAEMERRYGYFRGENPDRAKIRLTLETEPMALWLARAEVQLDLEDSARRKQERNRQ